MILTFKDPKINAHFQIIYGSDGFNRKSFTTNKNDQLLTIAWNKGDIQKVVVDEVTYDFPANAILPLVANQTFRFEDAEAIVAWQFNRDFYCIIDHDEEVSCVGFLFYGSSQAMFIVPDKKEEDKINMLLQVFKDEFETSDAIQGEMLRMLLVRLIITITRLAKKQYVSTQDEEEDTKFNLYREYNIMVEKNYRTHHEVQYYASALNKSPKTLANVFALYGKKTPLQIIQERVVGEAKRLLYYTDKSVKEIAAEIGFEDTSHFSRFFKKQTSLTPTEFKNSIKNTQ